MHHAIGVDVCQRLEHALGDADGAVVGKPALVENAAQRTALAPLHDHVNAGALFAAEHAHDVGVVETFTDACFALEAIGKERIGFHVGMGNLQGHSAVVAQVGGAIDGSHAAARDHRIDAVGINLRAGFKGIVKTHRASGSIGEAFSTVSEKQ